MHAMKETEFLRLKRAKLGVHDFEPLKVIGRGAFGEVKVHWKQVMQQKLSFILRITNTNKNTNTNIIIVALIP